MEVTCPQCHKEVTRHCSHCPWLVCRGCGITYGKNNYFKIEKTSETKRRKQNGVG